MEPSPSASPHPPPPTLRPFVLRLEPRSAGRADGRYLAWLLYPTDPANVAGGGLGETVPFRLPFPRDRTRRELERIEGEIRQATAPRGLLSFQGPRELGRALYDGLFDGPLGDRLRAERDAGRPLRLGLLIDPDEPGGRELCALPWELLYDNDHRSFLATSPDTPIVRHLWWTSRRNVHPSHPPEPCPVFCDPRRPRRRRPSGLAPDSERAIAAVSGGAPAAIAFQFPVSESALAAFGHALSQAQREGRPIEEAVTRGRQAIESLHPESWDWAAPVLYVADTIHPPLATLAWATAATED